MNFDTYLNSRLEIILWFDQLAITMPITIMLKEETKDLSKILKGSKD
jgi:hypothetical protein